jgi:hypothetical protein
MAHGQPTVTGFTETFLMATGFLLACLLAGMLVPKTMRVGAPIEASPAPVAAEA